MQRSALPIATTLVVAVLAAFPTPLAGLEMTGFELEVGYNEDNRLPAPVHDTSGLPGLWIDDLEWTDEPGRLVVFRMTPGVLDDPPKTKQPRFKLDGKTHLGRIFSQALRAESAAMGWKRPEDGWRIGGRVADVVVQLRTSGGGFGPYLFYGFLDLELTVASSDGQGFEKRYRFLGLSHIYNAGFGAQDEAKEALARFFIESAQEAIARLNREHFGAPPHPSVEVLLTGLDTDSDRWENSAVRLGLSGSEKARAALLELLPRERDEADRVNIYSALANLGGEGLAELLIERYGDEDEDCRLFIWKALEYAGGEAGRDFRRQRASRDPHLPIRVLAARWREP